MDMHRHGGSRCVGGPSDISTEVQVAGGRTQLESIVARVRSAAAALATSHVGSDPSAFRKRVQHDRDRTSL